MPSTFYCSATSLWRVSIYFHLFSLWRIFIYFLSGIKFPC
jgi:hypothetical protein